MRRRPPVLLASVVALSAGLLLGSSSARLTTNSDDTAPLRVTLLAGGPGMSPQMREDAREAPRALGIAQQDNSDLRALEVRVSELATDVRGLTRSLAHERQRTAALKIEQVPSARSPSLSLLACCRRGLHSQPTCNREAPSTARDKH